MGTCSQKHTLTDSKEWPACGLGAWEFTFALLPPLTFWSVQRSLNSINHC